MNRGIIWNNDRDIRYEIGTVNENEDLRGRDEDNELVVEDILDLQIQVVI